MDCLGYSPARALPGNVVDGIAGPANDPVFQARSPAYILSFTRRQTPVQ